MKNEFCVIEGCSNKAPYAELCHTHYQRLRKNGSVDADVKVRSYIKGGVVGPCLYCESPAVTKGMCMKHYFRVMKWGDPNKGRSPRALCEVVVDGEVCGKSAVAHRKCRKHYDAERRAKQKADAQQSSA